MARNYLIEMLKVLCTKCGKEIWCLVRSQEEINTLTCEDCLKQSTEKIEQKETITSSNPTKEENTSIKGEEAQQ